MHGFVRRPGQMTVNYRDHVNNVAVRLRKKAPHRHTNTPSRQRATTIVRLLFILFIIVCDRGVQVAACTHRSRVPNDKQIIRLSVCLTQCNQKLMALGTRTAPHDAFYNEVYLRIARNACE